MEKKNNKLRIVFWASIALGTIGLLDFLSRPLVTPLVEDYLGRESDVPISFLTTVYIDLKSAGIGGLGDLFFELVLFLNSLWFIFFIIAFAIHRKQKKNKVALNQNEEVEVGGENNKMTQTQTHATPGRKKLTLVGGFISVIFGLVFLSSIFSSNLTLFPLVVGGASLLGGFVLLRDYFGKKS